VPDHIRSDTLLFVRVGAGRQGLNFLAWFRDQTFAVARSQQRR